MNKKIVLPVCAAAILLGTGATGAHASANHRALTLNNIIENPLNTNSIEEYALKIKLDKKNVRGSEGKQVTLHADTNAEGYTVTFKSSNKKVATVDSFGVIKFKKEGKAKITAECNGVKKVCNVTVTSKTADKKAKDKKANSIAKSDMMNIVSNVGCQVDYAYGDSSIMCSAYSFAYAYQQVTGNYISPGSVWAGGCTWTGGTYYDFYTEADMLSTIKAQLDQNRACVGLLSMPSTDTHYVTFYGYTGDGTSLSDFQIADPWDAEFTTGAGYGYSGNGYDVVVIN